MHLIFFPLSLFVSATLLFIIQPMVAKVLLPIYGGTPAVWTVCMLFFQLLLLVAYAYVWILSRFNDSRIWRYVHGSLCLISLFFLPLALDTNPATGSPELEILVSLCVHLGLPLLVIGASAPLLQYAYSQTSGKRAGDPYFLYAASNLGSLLALLAYPWYVERLTGVSQQFTGWTILYLLYLGLVLCLFLRVRYQPIERQSREARPLQGYKRFLWTFLSFVPCSLMLGVTFYISTDIAATPLFWVLPLALYLLSFVLTFARKPLISHAWIGRNGLIVLVFPILGFIMGMNHVSALQMIVANLAAFFIVSLWCHGELMLSRPPANQLSTFYFCLSFGGGLAGLFNGVIAPRVFSHAYEYPLVILLALLCFPASKERNQSLNSIRGFAIPSLVFGLLILNHFFLEDFGWGSVKASHLLEYISLLIILLWPGSRSRLFLSMAILFVFVFCPDFNSKQILAQKRNFYGVKQVHSIAGAHALLSQSTLHGFQLETDPHPTDGARAYYGAVYPVVLQLQHQHQPLRAMVLGLGTGMMACQFRAEDKLSIVEIDEQVIDIAKNANLFTYLRDCPPQYELIKGDGLVAVSRSNNAAFDLLVMDAFNSDAIPVHLLTLEAFKRYQQKIASDGVILVNMTNRHLNILPVLTGVGHELEMIVLHKRLDMNQRLGQLQSEWVILTKNEALSGYLMGHLGWHFVTDSETLLWTNNYSNIIPLLKWQSA